MAAELRDLRAKVSVATDVALEATARATGKDKAEVARMVLHEWALEQIEVARVMTRLAHVEGITGTTEGK